MRVLNSAQSARAFQLPKSMTQYFSLFRQKIGLFWKCSVLGLNPKWTFKNSHKKKTFSHITLGWREAHSLFVCSLWKAILFFLLNNIRETTYLLQFLDSVHVRCLYCSVFPKGTWESEIPGLLPRFSAPCVTPLEAIQSKTLLQTQFICLEKLDSFILGHRENPFLKFWKRTAAAWRVKMIIFNFRAFMGPSVRWLYCPHEKLHR